MRRKRRTSSLSGSPSGTKIMHRYKSVKKNDLTVNSLKADEINIQSGFINVSRGSIDVEEIDADIFTTEDIAIKNIDIAMMHYKHLAKMVKDRNLIEIDSECGTEESDSDSDSEKEKGTKVKKTFCLLALLNKMIKDNTKLTAELSELTKRISIVECQPGGLEAWNALAEEKKDGVLTTN